MCFTIIIIAIHAWKLYNSYDYIYTFIAALVHLQYSEYLLHFQLLYITYSYTIELQC